MYIVQVLLPLSDNAGKPFPVETLKDIHRELASRFGGLTAYTRAPAEGEWAREGAPARDDIVVVEVMTDILDRDWWRRFRERTEHILQQDRLIIRAHPTEML